MTTTTLQFHSGRPTLDSLNQSSISLAMLSNRIGDVCNDPRFPRYGEIVEERLEHLKRIASQLGEDINEYPQLVFLPGALADELGVLIRKKEEALALSKAQQQVSTNIQLCRDFLFGRCTRGVTCRESHTTEDLEAHVQSIVASLAEQQPRSASDSKTSADGNEVFTVLHPFGREAWSALIRALQSAKTVRSLVLRDCDAVALRSISSCVKNHLLPSLRVIDISRNGIGSNHANGLLKLAKALRTNTTIEALSLGYNHLGAAGSFSIASAVASNAKTSLTALNLSGNGIVYHDAAFAHLCEAVATGGPSSLKKLSLAHNNLGADGVKKLLASLSSSDSPVRLECLDLFYTQGGDHGGAAAAEFIVRPQGSELRYLNLGWNRMTFEGIVPLCAALEGHQKIEFLSLPYNLGVGRKGSIAIAELIKKSTTLSNIDLRWTSLGDDGASTIADVMLTCKSLRSILMEGNDLDSRTEGLIAEKSRRLGAVSKSTGTTGNTGKSNQAVPQLVSPPLTQGDIVW